MANNPLMDFLNINHASLRWYLENIPTALKYIVFLYLLQFLFFDSVLSRNFLSRSCEAWVLLL